MVFCLNEKKISIKQNSKKIVQLTLIVILFIASPGISQPDSGQVVSDSELFSDPGSNSLSAEFFASVPFLWTSRDSSGSIYPGDGVLQSPKEIISYHPFDELKITLLKNASYKTGDTIDIISSLKIVRFRNTTANLVKRVGRGIVLTVESGEMTARLIKVWDVIEGKERIAHARQFSNLSFNKFVKADISLKARVFTRIDETESPYILQTLILDKGSDDGVRQGDIFTIYHHYNKDSLNFSSIGLTADVSSKSASVVLIKISDNHISDQDIAVLFKRIH